VASGRVGTGLLVPWMVLGFVRSASAQDGIAGAIASAVFVAIIGSVAAVLAVLPLVGSPVLAGGGVAVVSAHRFVEITWSPG
jgi:hypothetical protein